MNASLAGLVGLAMLLEGLSMEDNGGNATARLGLSPATITLRPVNPGGTNRVLFRVTSDSKGQLRAAVGENAALPSGLYRIQPYAGLVLVPEPHPDEKAMMVNPRDVASNMPVIRPPLRFRSGESGSFRD